MSNNLYWSRFVVFQIIFLKTKDHFRQRGFFEKEYCSYEESNLWILTTSVIISNCDSHKNSHQKSIHDTFVAVLLQVDFAQLIKGFPVDLQIIRGQETGFTREYRNRMTNKLEPIFTKHTPTVG